MLAEFVPGKGSVLLAIAYLLCVLRRSFLSGFRERQIQAPVSSFSQKDTNPIMGSIIVTSLNLITSKTPIQIPSQGTRASVLRFREKPTFSPYTDPWDETQQQTLTVVKEILHLHHMTCQMVVGGVRGGKTGFVKNATCWSVKITMQGDPGI